MNSHWSEVLERQAELIGFWDSPVGIRYGNGFPVEGAGRLARNLFLGLKESAPYWISADMTKVVWAASQSLPEEALVQTDDVPCSFGFAVLEEAVWVTDLHGDQVSVRGVAWAWAMADMEEGAPHEPVLMLTWYSDRYDELGLNDRPGLPRMLMAHVWLGRIGESYARSDEPGSVEPIVKFTRALWAMTEQRIGVVSQTKGQRHQRRQFERAVGLPAQDIRVVMLRRQSPHHAEEGDGDVNWTHRWIVDGHWRNQPYPSEGVHRLLWIAPYVKGPDDLPLVVKKTVKALVR